MSSTFQADIYQDPCKSVNIEHDDLKQVVLNHNEANSGITFEGNSHISVENSNDVVIGTLTQFMGPVTIMQQNSLKKPLTKDIPSISRYVPTSFVAPPSKIPRSPTEFLRKYKNCILCLLIIATPIVLIIIGLTLSVNLSYQELKIMETTTARENDSALVITKSDTLFRNTVKYVMISHSDGRKCNSKDTCQFTVLYHQNFHSHSVKYGNPNFAHNFFIGGDGYFYFDQGWNVKNNVSDNNIELCFMGNYTKDFLNSSMVTCAKYLISFGIKLGVIAEDYILVAHNQTYNKTDSPGKNVYAEIKSWPHWQDGYFPDA